MAAETTTTEMEFTEAEIETLGILETAPTGIESELLQQVEMEAEPSPEAMETAAVEYLEAEAGLEATGPEAIRRRRAINKNIVRVTIRFLNTLLTRMARNPAVKRKLHEAVKRGPDAVVRLVATPLAKMMPWYIRWVVPIALKAVVRPRFRSISRLAGATRPEMEAAELEFLS